MIMRNVANCRFWFTVAPTHGGLGCRSLTPPVPKGQPDRSQARSAWAGVWTFRTGLLGGGAESCQSDWRGGIQKIHEFVRLSLHFEPELADDVQTRGTFGIATPFGQGQIGL